MLVLETWTTPAALTAAGKTKVRTRLLKKAPRLGGRLTEEIFAALAAQTVVVTGTNAAGVVLPRLAAQLAALRQQRAEVAEKVEELVAAHPLSKVLMTMPGVGVRTCARILTEVVGKDFPTAGHLAFYAGLAPVTRRSGTSIRGEHPPRGGNKVLKRALFLLVGGTTGTACQGSHLDRVARGVLAGKLSQVQEHDNEKDVRSAGQRRSDTEHENASKARRLMQRNPAGGDVVVAA